jgi:hypothetical protein
MDIPQKPMNIVMSIPDSDIEFLVGVLDRLEVDLEFRVKDMEEDQKHGDLDDITMLLSTREAFRTAARLSATMRAAVGWTEENE